MQFKNIEKEIMRQTLVRPGKKLSLAHDYPSSWDPKWFDKKRAAIMLEQSVAGLAEFQSKLYAQDVYALLIVLQALDAAGKDGTIKHVMTGLNPQGCRVASFKGPSAAELDHDYLWRCIRALPPRGHIGIFNRSYYEEVLVVRVHPEFLAKQQLPPEFSGKGIWKRRFHEINNFEQYLYNNGVHVLKFFLHVSKDEQKRRFLERIDTPEKNWKFSANDVRERAHFDAYMEAYEDCIVETSTKYAPWHVIPADNKLLARLAVSTVIHSELRSMKLEYPKIDGAQKQKLAESKWLLENEH